MVTITVGRIFDWFVHENKIFPKSLTSSIYGNLVLDSYYIYIPVLFVEAAVDDVYVFILANSQPVVRVHVFSYLSHKITP